MGYTGGNEAHEQQFLKLRRFSELVEPLSRNRDPNTTQNEHVYAICCRPEAAGDANSGANVKTIEAVRCYVFKLLALVISELLKNHFVTAMAAAADIDDSIKNDSGG